MPHGLSQYDTVFIRFSPLVSLVNIIGGDGLVRKDDGVLTAEVKHLLGLPIAMFIQWALQASGYE